MALSFFSSFTGNRVSSKLQVLERQLSSDYPDKEEMDEAGKKTIDEIHGMLDQANIAVEKGDTELAWQLVHAIERTLLKLDSPSRLSFKKRALINETVAKLSGWRKQTVLDVLAPSDDPSEKTVDVDALTEGYQLLHEHFSNVYIKNRKILTQLLTLSATAFIAMLLFLVTSSSNGLLQMGRSISTVPAFTTPFIVSVLLFGVMGACLSGIFSLAGSGKGVTIPEMQVNFWITLSRPVVGAISALVIYLFLVSGLILPNLNFSIAGILSVSFAAGFTERIIIHAVKLVTDKQNGNAITPKD